MSRKWAAGESDSEEEVEQTPLTPGGEHRVTDSTQGESSGAGGSNEFSGMMMNIKYTATADEIRQFLESKNCRATHIEPFYRDNSFTGRARIDFEDKANFDQFLALHDTLFSDKPIITKVYEERNTGGDRRGGRGSGGNSRYGGSSGGRGGDRDRGDRRDGGRIGVSKSISRDSRDGRDGRFGDFRKSTSRDDFPGRGPRRAPAGEKVETKQASAADPKTPDEPEAPKERPKVILKPRTLPLETIGKTDKTSDIFGGGKPHDEFQYEEKKKQLHSSKAEPVADDANNLKVEKIALNEETKPSTDAPQAVTKSEETTTSTEPPKPPTTEEEEDNSSNKKYKGRQSNNNGGRNNDRKFNNNNSNGRSFSKSKSKDEDRLPEVVPEGAEPVGEKSEDAEHRQGDRRPHRKPRTDRSDDREFGGERKPFRKNENKGKKEKTGESQTETKKHDETETKPEPTKDDDGFEDVSKIKNKAKPAQKAAAAATKPASAATTPKSSGAPVPKKNAFAVLDSDSD